ncbi:NEDD4-binding protein 1 [Tiliqua scincoides]|uniref:NEDD4-binding protein 1 n=1 Tax=Tiliqua scincoides TaxID=71010 RepID=UPI00346269E5
MAASAPGAPPVLDEFTAPAEARGCLERRRAGIERLFRVRLDLLGALGGGGGGWAPLEGGRRIWLGLRGQAGDVRGAKEYIKGLCEPELEERECYPKDMHCIFVGAQALFLNCLVQGTCADIAIVEIGTLSIKGGAESVVMAQSRIQQFVSLFQNNASLLNCKESDVKKQFKQLVEAHADKYTMDLLILPSSLKRELLNLALSESLKTEDPIIDLTSADETLEPLPNEMQKRIIINNDCRAGQDEARHNAGTPVTELAKQMETVFPDIPERHFLPINGLNLLAEASSSKERQSCKRRSSDAEERLPKKQYSLENNQESKQEVLVASSNADRSELTDLAADAGDLLADPNLCAKEGDEISEEMEYKILVNFFKSMGYSQQIVEKVIGDHGQSAEPLLLLEKIEKESKKVPKKEDWAVAAAVPWVAGTQVAKGGCSNKVLQYPDHQLEPPKHTKHVAFVPQSHCKGGDKKHVSDLDNRTVFASGKNPQQKECTKVHANGSEQPRFSQASDVECDGHVNTCDSAPAFLKERKAKDPCLVARGAPETPHPPVQRETLVLQKGGEKSPLHHYQQGRCNPSQFRAGQLPSPKPNLPEHQVLNPIQLPQLSGSYVEQRTGRSYGHHVDPEVTGVQRFLESLKTPYKLELKNEPGKAHLKYIVIDGSNVAISHGLSKFFSCRGIAIAVDYFWKRGHRRITVFVPQWRTKRDSSTTEQHFLTQLQDVGILALTPARVVLGSRIASHDDRFLLHLAEKTGGVIVTNDNLREFVDESTSWREIIQKRLLPFTFAGDFFMVPDDPMGRKGPGLERFLQDDARFRGGPSQFDLASTGLPPPGPPRFLMQSDSSSQSAKNTLPGLLPGLPHSPPASPANLALPPHPRSAAETSRLKEALKKIFPTSEQREKIEEILIQHPHMRDMNALSAMVLDLS